MSDRVRLSIRTSVLLLLWVCGMAACTKTENVDAPTQIMLRISSSDEALLDALTRLRVRVALREGSGFKTPVEKVFPKAQLNWPVDVPIVPRVPEDAFKQFEVVVDALGDAGVLAQARIISGFVPREKRVLALNLFLCPDRPAGFVCGAPECSGAQCEVCASDGQCVGVESVDPEHLAPLAGPSSIDAGHDAGARPDAGGSEGGTAMEPPGNDASSSRDASASNDATTGPDASEGGSVSNDAAESGTSDEAGHDAGTEGGAPDAAGFVPVRFSSTDRAEHAALSADRLHVGTRGEGVAGVRSDRAIQPGSGVFYFEAERLIATPGEYGVGVATQSASLTELLGHAGKSLGVATLGRFADGVSGCTGSVDSNGEATFDAALRRFGFVVDYRTGNPRVHVLLGSPGAVALRRSCNLTLSEPLYAFYAGGRYEVGAQMAINTGADTTNFPFYFELSAVKAALTSAGEAAAAGALVAGFGASRAQPLNAEPSLTVPADRTLSVGGAVMLSASATDSEDGDLSGSIQWQDMASLHHAPLTGSGGSFSFTPGIGRHPLRVSVADSGGRTTSKTVMVTVTGTLPASSPVRLQGDALSAPSVNLSGDGLSVDFRQPDRGVRANTPIYGQYWYFEAHRNWPGIASIGVGVTVREAPLNPLSVIDPPWCATLFMTGFTTHNINQRHSVRPEHDHYGFAVDYRNEHPVVHILAGGPLAPQGEYIGTIEMNEVWTPLYPFIYGNALSDDSATMDATLNFGATTFVFNPVNVIGADRAAGIRVGWGP
jgi:hypothetical protein